MTYYAVVTFGSPRIEIASYYKSLYRAERVAQEAVGSGTCTSARVYACDTRQLAKTADISEVRPGERIVFHG